MREHPVLIPTGVGAMAGVVAEPAGDRRAAAVLLPGAGGPGRAGVNAFWARVSRELAEAGLVTLRFDYPSRGNGSSALTAEVDVEAGEDADLTALRDVFAWLRERLEGLDLFVAGECFGGRLAFELLPHEPRVAGVFAVVPYLREGFVPLVPLEVREAPGSLADDVDILDEPMVASLRDLLERGRPAWVLIGSEEGEDPFRLQRRLGDAGRRLEVEVVPDRKLHPVAAPAVQVEVGSRLIRRIVVAGRRGEIERRLREFIVEELIEEPYGGTDPLADHVVDSLAIEQLVEYIHESYGVALKDEEIVGENFESLPSLATFVGRKAIGP